MVDAVDGFRWRLCVCLFFRTISQKTDEAGITKLDIEMSQHESWKPICAGSKGQSSRSRLLYKKHCLHECWLHLVIFVVIIVVTCYDMIRYDTTRYFTFTCSQKLTGGPA